MTLVAAALPIAALVLLAIVDGAFAGFRAGAGRTGWVRPWRRGYYPRFVVAGAAMGIVAQLPALALGAWLNDIDDAAHVAGIARAATAILAVVGPYAAVVVVGLVLWVLAGVEGRTLASVVVLGPFTLLRPLVVLLALANAIRVSPVGVALTFAVGCGGVLLVEPLVGLRRRGGAARPPL